MKGVRSFQQNLPYTAIEAKFWVAIGLFTTANGQTETAIWQTAWLRIKT